MDGTSLDVIRRCTETRSEPKETLLFGRSWRDSPSLLFFFVRASSVCLVLKFHPKWDAITKLQRRTQSPKVSVSVASRYREMLREWTTQAGEIGTKRLKRSEQKGERLRKRLHRIAKACILFPRMKNECLFSLAIEPLHTISKPQVRT